MARSRASYLKELSTADLKQLLAARERIDVLEKVKARLVKELASVEAELGKLVAGVDRSSGGGARKKAVKKGVKKAVKKKAVRKKAAAKKTKARKSPAKKKSARKPLAKAKDGGKSGMRLEDIVVGIIKKAGQPVPYKEIMATIQDGKLFISRSANFDNVLRRTLSTSKKVKRAGRGIYELV